MPSAAWNAFDANLKDIERLLELHKQEGGTAKGRRYGLEVLNKSAIVLITSYWEAYCEDIAAEALNHIVRHAKSADALPKKLKQRMAKELKKDDNELALWVVADDGWRALLKSRLADLQAERNRKLNTPKTENIDELFLSALGIEEVSASWMWAKTTPSMARAKLDKFVTLRGAIAHRGKASESVTKNDVEKYLELVKNLAAETGASVNRHAVLVTRKQLLQRLRRT